MERRWKIVVWVDVIPILCKDAPNLKINEPRRHRGHGEKKVKNSVLPQKEMVQENLRFW
jgi:hypothetical protein